MLGPPLLDAAPMEKMSRPSPPGFCMQTPSGHVSENPASVQEAPAPLPAACLPACLLPAARPSWGCFDRFTRCASMEFSEDEEILSLPSPARKVGWADSPPPQTTFFCRLILQEMAHGRWQATSACDAGGFVGAPPEMSATSLEAFNTARRRAHNAHERLAEKVEQLVRRNASTESGRASLSATPTRHLYYSSSSTAAAGTPLAPGSASQADALSFERGGSGEPASPSKLGGGLT
jgi:hypothetical protein